MNFYVFLIVCGVLILIASGMLWSGIVNQIERRQSHALQMKRLEIKAADKAHEQWMEENKLKDKNARKDE